MRQNVCITNFSSHLRHSFFSQRAHSGLFRCPMTYSANVDILTKCILHLVPYSRKLHVVVVLTTLRIHNCPATRDKMVLLCRPLWEFIGRDAILYCTSNSLSPVFIMSCSISDPSTSRSVNFVRMKRKKGKKNRTRNDFFFGMEQITIELLWIRWSWSCMSITKSPTFLLFNIFLS